MGDTTIEVEGAHSMPSLEEAKTQTAINNGGTNNPHSGKNKRLYVLVGIIVVALSLIVGFSVAIVQNKKRSSATRFSDSGDDDYDDAEAEDPSVFETRSESRLDEVMDFLSVSISDEELFDDLDSPQYNAALWIADQDEAFIDIPEDAENYDESYYFVQRYIMAVFYYALDGPFWLKKAGFLSDKDVCDWNIEYQYDAGNEVEGADLANYQFGVQCVEGDRITHIFISSNGLNGELPAELGDLLDLEHLSLFENSIYGTFPERMMNLVNLNFVAIESNDLSGPLPNWINKWTNLEYLALGDNELTGELPDFFGLDNLVLVAIDFNELTGSIDTLNDCPELVNIFLNDNEFDGRLDDETLADLSNLETLELGDNDMTGFFPEALYYLRTVDLHNNALSEQGLPEVVDESPLQFLSLYGNVIPGPLPQSLGGLSELYHLDISDNALTGELTDTFSTLENLQRLYVSQNDFEAGEFPYLETCTELEELSLTDTGRTGPIPDYIGESLTNLIFLDLHDNDLTGEIPENFGNLVDLEWLMLNRNSLEGEVPESFADLEGLVTLFLDNNSLTGSLDAVCDAEPEDLVFFSSDCDTQVNCPCCNICCEAGDDECNNSDELDRFNDETERDQYVFSEDVIYRTEISVSP